MEFKIQDSEVERLAAQLKVTSSISEAINRSLNVDEVLTITLDRLIKHYGIGQGVFLVMSRTGSLRVGCSRGLPDPRIEPVTGLTRRVEEGLKPILEGSWLSIPIWAGVDLAGILHLGGGAEDFFSPADLEFLEPLAHVVGVAIANSRLYKALTDELRSSRTINTIARQITEGSLEIGQLLGRAGNTLKEHFILDQCIFFLMDTLRTFLTAVDTEDSEGSFRGLRVRMRSEPILNSVLRDRKAVVAEGASLSRVASLIGQNAGSAAVVPLVTGGRAVGMAVMGRSSTEGGGFSKGELERLETVAAYIAGALENSRLYQESLDLNRDLIELDAVTQLNPSLGDVGRTVGQLLDKAVAGTGAEAGIIYSVTDGEVVAISHLGENESIPSVMIGRLAAAARSAATEDRSVELRLPTPQTGSVIAIPLRSLTRMKEAMVVLKQGALEERDRRLCSVVADRIGSIMENSRLFQETRQHLNESTRRNEELVTLNRRNMELTEKLQAQLEARKREAELAADIQKSLLEDDIPQGTDLDVAVAYLPLEEASGDYYDVFKVDSGRTGIVITDAIGHGVPAAFVGGFSKMLLDVYKTRMAQGSTPGEVMGAINRRLCSYGHNQLMTMFLAVFDHATRTLSYANGGHPYPILCRADGGIVPLESKSHIMGAWPGEFEDRSIGLKTGDRILFYTDGLVEGVGPGGKRLGKVPIIQWFKDNRALWPMEINQGLYSVLMEFSGGKIDHDDVTLLTLAVLDEDPCEGEIGFSDLEEITPAWMRVKDGLQGFGYDQRALYSVRLAMEESMANAVRYGCTGGVPAVLAYRIDGTSCTIRVKDNGPGFRPDMVPDPTSPDKLEVMGGRGIFMIKRSVDSAEWNDTGNEVSMCKRKSRHIDILKMIDLEGASIMAEDLKFEFETEGNFPVLAVVGAADAISAPTLNEAVEQLIAKGNLGILDMSGVAFLGSAAVSILVKGFSAAKAKGVKFAIVKPSDADVAEMLEILGLLSIFPAAANRSGAAEILS